MRHQVCCVVLCVVCAVCCVQEERSDCDFVGHLEQPHEAQAVKGTMPESVLVAELLYCT